MLCPEKVSETEMNNRWFFIYWKDFDSDVQDDIQNTWMVSNCSGTSKWKTQVVYLMWLGNRRWIVVYLTLIAHVFPVYMETLVVLYVKWLTLEIQSAFHKTNKHNRKYFQLKIVYILLSIYPSKLNVEYLMKNFFI